MVKGVAKDVAGSKTEFKEGEAAVTTQLKIQGLYRSDRFVYKTDSIIKMYGLDKLEILLLALFIAIYTRKAKAHFGC